MDSEEYQIWHGPAKEACSFVAFVNHMPGGGSGPWRNLPRRHQWEVFLNRSRAGAVEQKVADFMRWMEDRSDVKSYMGIVNLVQLWVPISTGGRANDETILSASEQPFGVGRLSKGICRYRFCSMSCVRKACPGGGGDLIGTTFATGLSLFKHHQHDHHLYGVETRWTLPLVDPPTGMRIGVLEFVTVNDYGVEHVMLTKSFLESGPKYFKQFCAEMFVESHQYLVPNSTPHLPAQEFMNSDEYHNYSSTVVDPPIWGGTEHEQVQIPTQELHEITPVKVATKFMMNSTMPNTKKQREYVGYKSIFGAEGFVEQVQVRTEENLGGVTDDIIEETSEMVQHLNLGPAAKDSNSTPRPLRATSRKQKKRLFLNQLQKKRFSGRTLQEVANAVGVNRSTIKRWCRRYGILEWPSSKKRSKATKKNMIVKAEYGDIMVRVRNFDSGKDFEWLSKELGDRLKLQVGSFSVQYKGDTGDPVTISGTEHLMRRLDSLYSSNMKNMYLIVSPSN